jgi:hypothetical protein
VRFMLRDEGAYPAPCPETGQRQSDYDRCTDTFAWCPHMTDAVWLHWEYAPAGCYLAPSETP